MVLLRHFKRTCHLVWRQTKALLERLLISVKVNHNLRCSTCKVSLTILSRSSSMLNLLNKVTIRLATTKLVLLCKVCLCLCRTILPLSLNKLNNFRLIWKYSNKNRLSITHKDLHSNNSSLLRYNLNKWLRIIKLTMCMTVHFILIQMTKLIPSQWR